jgi:hypothetical protein
MSRPDTRTHAEKLLAGKETVEALEWLRGQNKDSVRSLAELSNDESQKVIDQIYQRGARHVWACEFVGNPPYEAIVWLVVELSDLRWKREDTLEYLNAQIEKQGLDPVADTGQRFQAVWFD